MLEARRRARARLSAKGQNCQGDAFVAGAQLADGGPRCNALRAAAIQFEWELDRQQLMYPAIQCRIPNLPEGATRELRCRDCDEAMAAFEAERAHFGGATTAAMKTPNFSDRLQAASAAKKALLDRARAMAGDPERERRRQVRDEVAAARKTRIAEREAARRALKEEEAAQLAAAQAAEAAAREAERKAQAEARAARAAERKAREAEAAAKQEAILAARREGRKKKKRAGH